MATLLRRIFKYKKVENYNFFSSLDEIKHMHRNQKNFFDNFYSLLAQVEIFLVSDSSSGDLTNPLDHNIEAPTIISSYQD